MLLLEEMGTEIRIRPRTLKQIPRTGTNMEETKPAVTDLVED